MFADDAIDYVEVLFTKPLFKKWFLEFFTKMEKDGIHAAERFWNQYHQGDGVVPKAPELFEKLIDFYFILGFVPRQKHEMNVKENERLKEENKRFMDILRELRSAIYDAQRNMREAWEEVMDRQVEISSGLGEGVRDFLRQMKGGEKVE